MPTFTPSPYSGLVISFNEQHNIEACIASLRRVCDDVVVIDSGSSDETVALARASGATVIVQQPFLGDGPQRSLGLPHCRHDWVINLDADERLEDDLVAWLAESRPDTLNIAAVECRRRNYVGQRFIPYAGQYPDYVCRVFNRRQVDFAQVSTHSRIQATHALRIEAHITHYSYRDYDDMFARINKYSTWQAHELVNNGGEASLSKAVIHGLVAFLKHYLLKRGFLAGSDGLSISLSKGLASYLKYAKAVELRRDGPSTH